MTDEEKTQEQIWDEVGEQFAAMGESLAAAVKATTQDEEVRQDLKGMQAELKATAARVSEKVKAAKDSGERADLDEETNRLGELSGKLSDHARTAGQDHAYEAQAQLSGALSSVQEGVSQIINNLKKKAE